MNVTWQGGPRDGETVRVPDGVDQVVAPYVVPAHEDGPWLWPRVVENWLYPIKDERIVWADGKVQKDD